MPKVILFNKPFQILCQFSPHEKKTTLKEFIPVKDFYPCGRLDFDSEGLMVLSNNGGLQALVSQPKNKMAKTYWVQVEGDISQDAMEQLRNGVILKDGKTKPAKIKSISTPNNLWERNPPIRERKNITTSWIELTITEGKNRQVRRMTAAVGFPTLRLVRASIGDWSLSGLKPGEWCYGEISESLLQKVKAAANKKSRKKITNAHERLRRSS